MALTSLIILHRSGKSRPSRSIEYYTRASAIEQIPVHRSFLVLALRHLYVTEIDLFCPRDGYIRSNIKSVKHPQSGSEPMSDGVKKKFVAPAGDATSESMVIHSRLNVKCVARVIFEVQVDCSRPPSSVAKS